MSATIQQRLPERLSLILSLLLQVLARHAARDRVLQPLALVLWRRFNRTLARFSALVARHRAGRLRVQARPRRDTAPAAPPPPGDPLPRQRGWLIRRIPECNAHGEYLRILLEDPEMTALLAASPQARRLLRPLWRMLRFEAPPPVLRSPSAASPRGPRLRPSRQDRPSSGFRPDRHGPPPARPESPSARRPAKHRA